VGFSWDLLNQITGMRPTDELSVDDAHPKIEEADTVHKLLSDSGNGLLALRI
jgi:hypothetical protein